jgi:hypothetical protein
MNKHLKIGLIGLIIGSIGTGIGRAGYRELGFLLGLIGWGVGMYGIGGGLWERITQSHKE